MNNLTAKKKAVYFPLIVRRDGGFKCFYCKKDLSYRVWVYEHLDNNPRHSEIENIVIACQSCNLKKRQNPDLEIMAMEKRQLNQKMNLSYERDNLELEGPTLSPEMDVNRQNFEITHQYLKEIVTIDGSIEVKDAINSSAMLCNKKTGHGSSVATRRYVDMLCSREGPFMIQENDAKKRIIVKRTGK